MLFAALVLASLSIGATGCRSAAPHLPVRSDSAGVEIVLNPAVSERAAEVVSFRTDEVLDIGGLHASPELELRVSGSHDAIRLPNGSVMLANGHELRRYTADGTQLGIAGRRGEGPGEFQSQVWGLCRTADGAILALEVPNSRIGVTDSALGSITTNAYRGRALYRACLREGFLAMVGDPQTPPDGGPSVVPVGHIAPDGTHKSILGTFPGDDNATIFPREAMIAAAGDKIAVGDGRAFEYRLHRQDGTLFRVVRTSDRNRTLSRDDVAAIVRKRLGSQAPDDAVASGVNRAMGGQATLPVPAFMRMNVDEAGRVWLAEPKEIGGPLEQWMVFDSTGVLLGRVDPNTVLPEGSERPITIRWTATDLIVKYLDRDGARHVRLVPYTISPAAGDVATR